MADRRTFVKTIDGRRAVQYAYAPADAVRLEFNGWREELPPPDVAADQLPADEAANDAVSVAKPPRSAERRAAAAEQQTQ